VILREKISIREIIGSHCFSCLNTIEKIYGGRNIHVWLSMVAENYVGPRPFSRVDVLRNDNECIGLNSTCSDAFKGGFVLMLGTTKVNELHGAKTDERRSENE